MKNKLTKHLNFSSISLWNEKFDDVLELDKHLDKLDKRVVFIGLNATKTLDPFLNFHSVRRGGRDRWIKEAFDNGNLGIVYMTDVIKNDTTVDSGKVNLSKENIKENLKYLKQELLDLSSDKKLVIAVGGEVKKIILNNKDYLGVEDVFCCRYYASRCTKDEFLRSFSDVVKEIIKI
jgi:hypothetical protein